MQKRSWLKAPTGQSHGLRCVLMEDELFLALSRAKMASRSTRELRVCMEEWVSHFHLFSKILVEIISFIVMWIRRVFTYQFTIMMLAVSTILDIVQVISCLFTQQSQLLSTSHVELLLTSGLIALHTSPNSRFSFFASFMANVTI